MLTRILTALALTTAAVAGPVTLDRVGVEGHAAFRLENDRFAMVVTPARGGAVTAFRDKTAKVDLILQKKYQGLCLDHFQAQSWPGEFLEEPYVAKVLEEPPEGVGLDKVYTVRADSPAFECAVTLHTPDDAARVFGYWLQNVYFAGGTTTGRPTARSVPQPAVSAATPSKATVTSGVRSGCGTSPPAGRGCWT